MNEKTVWESYTEEDKKKVYDFCEEYRTFLSKCKTERECVKEILKEAEVKGYRSLKEVRRSGEKLQAGDKVYVSIMGKTLALFHIGKEPMEKGMNILGAHIDSPRLDLKQNPLYESDGLAMLETHYYGGIKKYQWVAMPLALHGVVAKKDGTSVEIALGEDPSDPVIGISDLLPHLGKKQMEKRGNEVVEGEDLNILVGTIPLSGEEKAPEEKRPLFEHYVRSGQKLLRCGYTTGTCAALGAAGAARLLLTGHAPESVGLRTPKGIVVEVAPQFCRLTADGAACAIVKDGGDDIDATTGLPVIAAVTLLPGAPRTVTIDGGAGVGRVTKPGLDQPVGAAAINRVPRQMITEALLREADAVGYGGGFAVVISIEGGEAAAKRTFNPHLGVEGGLSVLGTSGIVEPMSQQALLDTLQIEIHQAALKSRRLILAPGNYGLDYLAANYPALHEIPVVKISNFIGEALDMAAAEHFAEVLLVGHVGKLVKLAGGIMNTHSRCADCRTELFCAHAALCGADAATCRALMDAATTDACLDILDAAQLREPVMASLLTAIQTHLDRRAAGAFKVGAVLFSNRNGPLGQTKTADTLLKLWKEA